MNIEPKFQDGTPFSIGMTVVTKSGREIKTNTEEFKITTFVYNGQEKICLSLARGSVDWEICLFFPSQKARIDYQVNQLELMKVSINHEIEYLKDGGSPNNCSFIHGRIEL